MLLKEEELNLRCKIKQEEKRLKFIVFGSFVIPVLFALVVGLPVAIHFDVLCTMIAIAFSFGISTVCYRHFFVDKKPYEQLERYNKRLDEIREIAKPINELVFDKIMGVDDGAARLAFRLKFDKEKYDVIPVIIAEALKNLSDLKIKLKLSEEDYEYFLDAAHTLIDMSLSSAFHGLTLCLTYNNHKEVCDYIKDFCEKIDPIIGTYDSQLKEDFNLNEMLGLESEDNAE